MKPNVGDMTKAIKKLDRDDRGYPIPFVVLRDRLGKPVFSMNDERKLELCRRGRLCSVCGHSLHPWVTGSILRENWFVGGSRSFLHPNGVFHDPPVHYACGVYALRVCPFLAASSYTKSVAQSVKMRPDLVADLLVADPIEFVGPVQPEWFAIGLAKLAILSVHKNYMVPTFNYVEFWKNGSLVPAPTALEVRKLVNLTKGV